jgi:hypothetical protein
VCGGAPVKGLRCCLILILLGLSSSAALANSIPDPGFSLGGGGHSIILISPNDPAFKINYVAGTTPTVDCGTSFGTPGHRCIDPFFTDFTNNTHQTFTAISFDITKINPSSLAFSCDNTVDPYFDNCSSTIDPITGHPVITFSGTTTHPGILPADSCVPRIDLPPLCSGPTTTSGDTRILLYDFLVLVDVNDALAVGDTFLATGSATVPEPPSVLLALAGGMLLFLFKRAQGIFAVRLAS